MVGFIRFQSAVPSRGGRFPGVFAMANGLAWHGRLSAIDVAWWRASNARLTASYVDPSTVAPECYDRTLNPGARAWFKESAGDQIELAREYLVLLDRYDVGWVELRTTAPGRIVYEDDVQVVAVPYDHDRDWPLRDDGAQAAGSAVGMTTPAATVGDSGGMDTSLGDRLAPATPPSPAATTTTIRMAGIEDITVIARITQEGPPRSNLDPELVARATRLLLTHVAFEHGALWVEVDDDGRIARAVAVIPGTDVTPWATLGRVVGSDLPAGAPGSPEETEVGRAFAAELAHAAPSWVLSEISRTQVDVAGRVALLEAALDWARRQCVDAPGAIALVADSQPEAQAAQNLGFVELHASDSQPSLWLGLAPSGAVPPRD